MAQVARPIYDHASGAGRRSRGGAVTAIVLFTDLVGSTELRSRLGEDAAEEVRHKHDALVADAVEASRGHLVKNLGDGIMATFAGASDAIAAAIAIQQAIGRYNRSSAAALEVRIGISAGDVVFEDDDCFGTPVIEAARLCGAASGGQILASAIVRWLARSSERSFTPIGNLELKGLTEPIPTVQIEWEPLPDSPVPLPTFLTDIGRIFVGREDELKQLGQLWKEATTGELRVALLAGEPGVGKTRLAAELAGKLHHEGATVLVGRCDEDLGVPYQPFVESLRHFVDHAPALPGRLGRYGGELVRLVPELTERVPGLPSPLRSDPETERYRLFDAVAAWLTVASADSPMLLVLDDLQWAAKPTLMLLRHIVRAGGGRVLIVATYRDSELTHDHPLVDVVADLRREGMAERLSLSGLDDMAVAAIVEHAAGQVLDDDAVALSRAIYEETEGNPFFVREVLRHLSETSASGRQDQQWWNRLPIDRVGIPEGVRDVVGRRLSRLSEDANQALRVAAVVGSEFEVDVVRAAAEIAEDTLLAALDEAFQARLVTEVSSTRVRFSHALVRSTLYESLTAARKIALHRRVAKAIESIHQAALDDHLPALAHHWAKASAPTADTATAVAYARRAGDRALAQLAHDEAASYYRQALEMLSIAGMPSTDARRLELLIALGEAQRRSGDDAHRETLLEAARMAQQRGDTDALTQAALGNYRGFWSAAWTVDLDRVKVLEAALDSTPPTDTPERARLLANLAAEIHFSSDWGRRKALSDEALAMARRLGDEATIAHVILARCAGMWLPATAEERLANTAELLSVVERLNDPAIAQWSHLWRFIAALELGDLTEADRSLEKVIAGAAELGQPMLLWMARFFQANRALLAGRLEDAERLALEARDLGRAAGQPDAQLFFGGQRFQIRFEQGRLGELVERLVEVVEANPRADIQALLALAYSELGAQPDAARMLASLSENLADWPVDSVWLHTVSKAAIVAARLGDRSAASRFFDLLTPYATHLVSTGLFSAGSVTYYLGLLTATLGRFGEADRYFGAAQSTHARIAAPTWLARTRLEWARMLLARAAPGDGGRAEDLLRQALATARQLGLANIERGAAELLGSR